MGLRVSIEKKLGDFSLHIDFESKARRIGILGPSGCGKSLTLKSIAGIERPDAGRIEIDGRVLFDRQAKVDVKPQKRNVGYMFQNYALFPTMTVAQNIAAGLHENGPEKEERIREMIERFHLKGLESHYPAQLSGGQQQRAALARIMAYRPDLIMLDEPFSALDQHLRERMQHELADMLEDYAGQVIMVSHSRDEIYRFAEELLIMDEGRILVQGETRALFAQPGTPEVARMTGCKNIFAAEKTGASTLRLTKTGTVLHLTQDIPDNTTAVGYRAHFFEPVWLDGTANTGEQCLPGSTAGTTDSGSVPENCLPCRIAGMDELPFERRYYIEAAPETESICWFVQDSDRRRLDKKPAPDYLRMKEEHMLLLHEED